MSFKTKNDICIIANKKIIVSKAPLERLKKSAETRKRLREEQNARNEKQQSKHKDPLDALGNFVSELDLDKIDADLDFENVQSAIKDIIGEDGANAESIINEEVVYRLCKSFDYNMRQLLEMLMEKFPSTFTLGFVKSKIKPFILNLQKEKLEYQSTDSSNRSGYRAIFSVL